MKHPVLTLTFTAINYKSYESFIKDMVAYCHEYEEGGPCPADSLMICECPLASLRRIGNGIFSYRTCDTVTEKDWKTVIKVVNQNEE